jgi:DNA-binding CsgD family transcriptional regulator
VYSAVKGTVLPQRRRRLPHGITAREAEILALLRDGHGNREIAARLVISQHTVRAHLEHIFEKLDVHTRTAAVRRAYGTAPAE